MADYGTTPRISQDLASPDLTPNLDEAARFLRLLDPDADRFSFQTFDDSPAKRRELAHVFNARLEDVARSLAGIQRAGGGVFVTINQTDLRGRRTENIVRVRAAFVDLDGAPLDPVMRCGLTPHIVAESSPGRWHAYWLTDGLPLDQFTMAQKAIIARFGGDPVAVDLPRVMRLPGFWHLKGEPFMSRIVDVHEALPYSAEQILAEFPPGRDSGPRPQGKPIQEWRDLVREDITEGGRNIAITQIAGLLLRKLPDPILAAVLVACFNEVKCKPPLDEAELARTIDSVAAKEFRRRSSWGK